MATLLPPDWREFFAARKAHKVRFVVVGGLAIAAHAEPRFTEDLDVFVEASAPNATRLHKALLELGFGEATPSFASLSQRGPVCMLGRKPLRIDVSDRHSQRWTKGRVDVDIEGLLLPVSCRNELLANKEASARSKDLRDLTLLARHGVARSQQSLRLRAPKKR